MNSFESSTVDGEKAGKSDHLPVLQSLLGLMASVFDTSHKPHVGNAAGLIATIVDYYRRISEKTPRHNH